MEASSSAVGVAVAANSEADHAQNGPGGPGEAEVRGSVSYVGNRLLMLVT